MMRNKRRSVVSIDFERPLRDLIQEQYILRLYVTGSTLQSMQAIKNIKRFCDENLKDHYNLQVIDLYQQPELAKSQQIVAAPTLIIIKPLPFRRIIGDLSDTERLLGRLGICKAMDT